MIPDNLSKMTPGEAKIALLKSDIEHKIDVYNKFIQVLVTYHIGDVGYSAIMAEELLSEALLKKVEMCKDKPEEFREFMFGKFGKSEIETLEYQVKYYDRLIDLVKNRIEQMPEETKIKIAKDSIEKMHAWLNIDLSERKEDKNEKRNTNKGRIKKTKK